MLTKRRTELWEPIRQLQQEMDQVVQQFFGSPGNGPTPTGLIAWVPQVDVEEDDQKLVVRADLPGVNPKDVEISVVDETLVIRGQKMEEREEKKRNYHRIERFQGEFYREIPLPRGLDTDRVEATSNNGMLMVTIPKKAEAQPKKITVQAAESNGNKPAANGAK
jgi:HSP20 family protein